MFAATREPGDARALRKGRFGHRGGDDRGAYLVAITGPAAEYAPNVLFMDEMAGNKLELARDLLAHKMHLHAEHVGARVLIPRAIMPADPLLHRSSCDRSHDLALAPRPLRASVGIDRDLSGSGAPGE